MVENELLGVDEEMRKRIVLKVKQTFPQAMAEADKNGKALLTENYMIVNLDKSPQIEMTDDEKIDFVAARILREHKAAFEELAK